MARIPSIFTDLWYTNESGPHAFNAFPSINKPSDQRSLFGEILDWMFAPLVLIWPLSIVVTFLVARSLADIPFDRNLTERAETLSQQVRIEGLSTTVAQSVAAQYLALSEEDRNAQLYQVIGSDGKLYAGDPQLPPPTIYDFPDPGKVKLRIVDIQGVEFRVAYTYKVISPRDDNAPSVLVQVAESTQGRNSLANEIVKGVIFPQFLILPISLWLAWFGLRRGLLPLHQMEQRLQLRKPDDLSPIDPRGTPEEIMPLVHSFNGVLGKLGDNIGVQKRFIADAAHQMKTPLAGLKMQAELALRQTNPQELRNSLRQIVMSSDRAARLVSQLLALARTENLRDEVALAPVELSALTQSVTQELAPNALAKSIDLGFESPTGPTWVDGHSVLLHELIQNLIDNALRYTPKGGIVTVRVRQVLEDVLLEVEDNGPGIAADDRDRIFDRFFQGSEQNQSGSGLGLSIVAEIAKQHRAQLSVEPGLPGIDNALGARFTLTLSRRRGRTSDRSEPRPSLLS